jgi:hypothetical protein
MSLLMLMLLQVTKVDTSGTAKAVVQSFKEMGTSSNKPVSEECCRPGFRKRFGVGWCFGAALASLAHV